jgi:hypothetical protein
MRWVRRLRYGLSGQLMCLALAVLPHGPLRDRLVGVIGKALSEAIGGNAGERVGSLIRRKFRRSARLAATEAAGRGTTFCGYCRRSGWRTWFCRWRWFPWAARHRHQWCPLRAGNTGNCSNCRNRMAARVIGKRTEWPLRCGLTGMAVKRTDVCRDFQYGFPERTGERDQ